MLKNMRWKKFCRRKDILKGGYERGNYACRWVDKKNCIENEVRYDEDKFIN